MKLLRSSALLLASIFLSVTVHAKGYGPVVSPTSTGFNIRYSKDGTPLAVPTNGAGGVSVGGTVPIALPAGKILEIAAAAAIPAVATAGPWGLAAVAVGTVAIFAIPAFADAYARAKMRVKPDGTIEKADPSVCTVAPCYEYALNATNIFGEGKTTGWQPSLGAATSMMAGLLSSGSIQYAFESCDGSQCSWRYAAGNHTAWSSISKRNVNPATDAYVPITLLEAQVLFSASAPTAAEVQALVDLNFPPVPELPVLTGPAEVPLGNTVQLGIDGTKTTVEQTAQVAYFPGKVDITTKKKTTVETPAKTESSTTTNPDGTTSTTVTQIPAKTTVLEEVKPELPEDMPPTDSPLPEVPKLYTPAFPDGLVGVWAARKAALMATPLLSLVPSLMPNVAGAGSCPTMPVNLNFASWANFGTKDVAPPCYVWEWAKLIVLAGALLLARALVFGG